MATVSAVVTKTYQEDEVYCAVCRHFQLCGMKEILKPGLRVVVKPNLLMKRKPDEHTTTHPAVVAAVVRCLQEYGVEDIVIADSPGGPYRRQALHGIYEECGMAAVAREYSVKLNEETGYREVPIAQAKLMNTANLIDPVADADLVVSVAKLKTHSMAGMSGAVKNLFGCIPGLMKPELHYRFPEAERFADMLVDLCLGVKPALTIVDAVVSMEGNGPSSGENRETRMTFAGTDAFALDMVLCDYIGMGGQVETVRRSLDRGLVKPDGITVVGDPFQPVLDFKKPDTKGLDFLHKVPKLVRPAVKKLAYGLMSSRPAVKKRICIGCGKCAESCPAKTIAVIERKAVIDYGKCIKCYCCHEMCPVAAIRIRQAGLWKW